MKRMSGMTLVELMVSIGLGVVVSMFISGVMISSARNANTAEGITQAQETGRLVMAWLSDYLIKGGYESNYLAGTSANYFPVAELCASNTTPPVANGHCSFNRDNGVGDRIAIRRKTGGLNPSSVDLTACTGENLPSAIVNGQNEVVDVFWVADDSLKCITYNAAGTAITTTQSIANGVESLHFLVGVGSGNGTVERFVAPSATTDWRNVVALRVSVLTKEFGSGTLESDTRVYGLLNADPMSFTDTLARHIETGTVWFPNSKRL